MIKPTSDRMEPREWRGIRRLLFRFAKWLYLKVVIRRDRDDGKHFTLGTCLVRDRHGVAILVHSTLPPNVEPGRAAVMALRAVGSSVQDAQIMAVLSQQLEADPSAAENPVGSIERQLKQMAAGLHPRNDDEETQS